MKKLIFAALAVCVLSSCDPTVKDTKCNDLTEMQEAILQNSTDTARYDLNGDGEVTIADLNFLTDKLRNDSTSVDSVRADSL